MGKKILILYAVSIVLGVLTGTIASLFQLAIAGLVSLMNSFYSLVSAHGWPEGLISALVTMVMVLLAFLLVKYVAPEASGSGVPEIEGTLLHIRPIFWKRLIPVKFFGGILSISANMVMGREGPTIQMGGNLGDMLGDLLRLSPERRDTLIAAGSAAGLAAAFNAPLAGVLFVMEEMRNQFNYSFTNFKMVIICCVMATITLHGIIGPDPAIKMQLFELPSLSALWWFCLFGIVVGFVGVAFNLVLMGTLRILDKLHPRNKMIYVMIVGFLVGYLAYIHPQMVGGGYDIINQALTMSPAFGILCLLIVIRFFTTMMSYSTSIPGGIFAPMLALGTLLGLAAYHIFGYFSIDTSIHPGMFAVAGMGALFAASVRSPITGVVLVVEMTQNYSLILPLMITCITSTTIVQLMGNEPIYTQLLERTLKLGSKAEEKKAGISK
ncbi:H(+)/Cl(-) exchange transporter ClcA [Legionella bononiensis]|uniref:H(+)/Cl(-) exchange transporter ClcA n=1 Tax=Legionella bononiensis TaxID=2793102 RepID=A0ABS1WCN7_9GAMM|nr:H(+)/Cl(-) exchange transporter ClcA [Legionella bononiensis]MBL7478973.1 H(+)/Cl(-) exchange transporter ClcA [Legionella bononiensis]MBL7527105.1 H(+)/Cl(-) exchange transporter ClcA [Legionella bononiensis]MBL7562074.1 H(+)/Cl(-) exchange transporter ClcA [Legionella bononiensis]